MFQEVPLCEQTILRKLSTFQSHVDTRKTRDTHKKPRGRHPVPRGVHPAPPSGWCSQLGSLGKMVYFYFLVTTFIFLVILVGAPRRKCAVAAAGGKVVWGRSFWRRFSENWDGTLFGGASCGTVLAFGDCAQFVQHNVSGARRNFKNAYGTPRPPRRRTTKATICPRGELLARSTKSCNFSSFPKIARSLGARTSMTKNKKVMTKN